MLHRYIPIRNSLVDDAPGYSSTSCPSYLSASVENEDDNRIDSSIGRNTFVQTVGPNCWKCWGKGEVKVKHQYATCKVCRGSKTLSIKKINNLAQRKHDIRMTIQSKPPGWIPAGPSCANEGPADGEIHSCILNGVQLCVLVGNWRIFQRVGGHRWTTDDLVTAWVSGKTVRDGALAESKNRRMHNILDLGCGNGSVLLMMAWQFPYMSCTGMEARKEAVELARKSIAYNCGGDNTRIKVINRDFRCLYSKKCSALDSMDTDIPDEVEDAFINITSDNDGLFDIVTGTPPYFKVDFEVDADTSTVLQAIIREGGMPTCRESAPARCEFRGGIEAYCLAAAASMSRCGVFTVCENWMNHERVVAASTVSQLTIFRMQRVIGREGKPPLFCVYSMRHHQPSSDNENILMAESVLFEEDLVVRDRAGAWTPQYLTVLHDMSYPVASVHPSGRY